MRYGYDKKQVDDILKGLGPRPMGCTEKQARLVRELLIAGEDDTQETIAKRAGYLDASAATSASRTLKSHKVQKLMEFVQSTLDGEISEVLTLDGALKLLSKLAQSGNTDSVRKEAANLVVKYHQEMGTAEQRMTLSEALEHSCNQAVKGGWPCKPYLIAQALEIAYSVRESGSKDYQWQPKPEHIEHIKRWPDLLKIIGEEVCAYFGIKVEVPEEKGARPAEGVTPLRSGAAA